MNDSNNAKIKLLRGFKIRLNPTPEQEILFWKSAGVARWSYNFYLSEKERVYKEYLNNGKIGKKNITEGEVRKYINNVLKPTTHKWLSEVGSNVMKQAVKDADNAYDKFFKKLTGKPKFKTKRKDKISFYVNYESLKRKPNGFRGEKLGIVKTYQSLPKLQKDQKYFNPHIIYDGKYWYLTFCIEIEYEKQNLTDNIIGIDLGIKNLAVLSTGKIYKNINKTKRIKQLSKRLKHEQRKLLRKILKNTKSYINNKPIYKQPLNTCKNIERQNRKIKKIYRRITNIRNNYLHQTTREIVKTKPSRIVMEDLNIQGMMKNRHLAKSIAE